MSLRPERRLCDTTPGTNGGMENLSVQSHHKYVHAHIFTILVTLKLKTTTAAYYNHRSTG